MEIKQQTNFFEIKFSDKSLSHYHFVWLRHNCGCLRSKENLNGCHHEHTKEKILNLSTISLIIKPKTYKINKNTFEIVWEDDHKTVYEENWLKEHQYAPVYEQPPLEELQVEHKNRTPNKLLNILKTYGVVVVRNGSNDIEETFKIAEDFGSEVIDTHFGKVEDLMPNNKTNKNNDQLGYTFDKVDLHTDQPFIEKPPSMQLLHCIKRAEEGGGNRICNVKLAVQELKKRNYKYFKLLSTIPVHFKRRQKEFQSDFISPILKVDSNDNLIQIRYSYFTMAPFNIKFNEMISFYEAFQEFDSILHDDSFSHKIQLNAGDYLVYNNHTCVHARDAFKGDRHLRGIYLDIDQVFNYLSK
eukprot:gene2188-2052_t